MKKAEAGQSRMLRLVNRLLIICLAAAAVIFAAGTVYGVFFHGAPPARAEAGAGPEDPRGQTFTGIGRLRVATHATAAGTEPGMVVMHVSFFFHPEDKAFSEELALRIKDFREIISGYIGSFSAAEIEEKGEQDIKAELRRRFNAVLRLGQIGTLYFSDFMIIGA